MGGIEVDLSQVTNFAGTDTVAALSQNGGEMGSLQAFSIGQDGTLVGIFSNGLKSPLAQLAVLGRLVSGEEEGDKEREASAEDLESCGEVLNAMGSAVASGVGERGGVTSDDR